MKPKRYSRQWNTALKTVHNHINRLISVQSSRLPSVKELAADAGVSMVTMWKTVHSLCEEGILESIPRGGFIIVRKPAALDAAEHALSISVSRTQHLLTILREDIALLRARSESKIPTQKQLSVQYRTSPNTMRKILTTLVAEKVIVPDIKGYRIFRDHLSEATASIMIFAVGDKRETARHLTPRSTELWQVIDRECADHNIRLQLVSFWSAVAQMRQGQGRLYKEIMQNRSILGFVVMTLGLTDIDAEVLINGLRHGGKPVALIDEGGQPFLRRFASLSFIKIFLLGTGSICGQLTGEHLLRMGHKRIAWITPASGERDHWVRARLEGLRMSFKTGGRSNAVSEFVLDRYNEMGDIQLALSRDHQMQQIEKKIRSIPDMLPPPCPIPDELFIVHAARRYLWFRFVRYDMEKIFEKALADKSFTAWVLCNDEIAVMALDFLQRNKIPVPQKIALCGFDDGEMSQTRDITSYNFNIPRVVQGMFDFFLKSTTQKKIKDQLIEIPGYVSVRESTGFQVRA